MDLSTVVAANTTVDIRHPGTGENIGLQIALLPPSSDPVKAVQRRLTNEALKTRGKSMTADKLEVNRLDSLTAAICGWTWGTDSNGEESSWAGEKLEFSAANVRRVLKDAPWLRDQVDEAIGDEAGFFKS